jgi:hypothetical protein
LRSAIRKSRPDKFAQQIPDGSRQGILVEVFDPDDCRAQSIAMDSQWNDSLEPKVEPHAIGTLRLTKFPKWKMATAPPTAVHADIPH